MKKYRLFQSTYVIFNIIFFILIFLLFQINLIFSNTLIDHLYKQKHSVVFEIKAYNISQEESIVLYGAKNKKFLNDHVYWGEAGYGSISGIRGGYLEGGLIIGFEKSYKRLLNVDYRFFMGAGGGGAAPQGGGFIVNPTIGIGTNISSKWKVFLDFGYIKFLNGNISSKTIAFNINRNFWNLFINE